LFFTLSPEKAAIEGNMQRAFNLSDKTAFDYYKDLLEKGYYSRIISGNIQQRVEVDSIKIDFNAYPYKTMTYATQYIIRSSNLTKRNLITSSQLVSAVRSDNNPQGFIIEKFTVLENKDLEVVKR
ncbi:conjugative transposon protein TraK, partial [Myroides odoratimimus]